jgi:hypothetical protein
MVGVTARTTALPTSKTDEVDTCMGDCSIDDEEAAVSQPL